jgi:phage shock protein A
MTEASETRQSIEELTKRFSELNTKKIQAETNLKNAEQSLAKLREKAREDYGTDDIDKLKAKLAEMEAENEHKRSEYQRSLDKIEADLEQVERKYADVKDGKEI